MQSFYNNGGVVGVPLNFNTTSFYQQPLDVEFVGYASATSNTATVTVNLTALNTSASIQEGDTVIVFAAATGTSSVTMSIGTTGYTTFINIIGNDSFDTRFIVGRKTMGATPDTSVQVSESGANFVVATAYVFRNVNSVTSVTATGGNTGQWNSPAIDPNPPNSGKVLIISAGASVDTTGFTAVPPTGYNNNNSSVSAVGTYGTVLGVGTKEWTSGTEDPDAWSGVSTATSASWAACTIALYSTAINLNKKNSGVWNAQSLFEAKYFAAPVTRGVRMFFDAGSELSYPDKSGTGIWYDLINLYNGRGSLIGNPTYNERDKAINFDGSTNGVDVTPNPGTSIADNFTWEIWCKPTWTHEIDTETNSTTVTTGTTGQRYIIGPISGGATGGAGAGISIGTNGVSVYEHADAYMPPLLVYSGTISSTEVSQIVVVYENKQPKLYVNGVLVRTGLTSLRTNVWAHTQTIGYGQYGYYSGAISMVRLYNVALTQDEVQQNYNIFRASKY